MLLNIRVLFVLSVWREILYFFLQIIRYFSYDLYWYILILFCNLKLFHLKLYLYIFALHFKFKWNIKEQIKYKHYCIHWEAIVRKHNIPKDLLAISDKKKTDKIFKLLEKCSKNYPQITYLFIMGWVFWNFTNKL